MSKSLDLSNMEVLGPDESNLETSKPPLNFVPPEYTIKEVYDAIPPHCLERNSLLSLGYILRDFLFIAILMSIATQIPLLQNSRIQHLAWIAYTFAQGLVFTGLWELAHESGHGALSKKKWVNNLFGMVIHSFLLVPFHSWRITHATHHKSTANLETEIAFVPDIKEVWDAKRQARRESLFHKVFEICQDTPIAAVLFLAFHQVIAWPIYLILNNFAIPRMAAVSWWKRSHFYFGGDGPIFKPQHTRDIIISDLGIGVAVFGLWACTRYFGAWNVALFYGFPYLWTNNWILVITFLQHTDTTLPYYQPKTWTFLRGCASTIDRDFGWIGRFLFHGAIETHVLHHHVARIPFYHASEASIAIRKVMGTHYKADFKTPYIWAFWSNFRKCRFVKEIDPGSDIYFFDKTE